MGDSLPTMDIGLNRTVKDAAAGISHTCAVFTDGSVKCWVFSTDLYSGSDAKAQTSPYLQPLHVPTAADLRHDSPEIVQAFMKDPNLLCSICLKPPVPGTDLLLTV